MTTTIDGSTVAIHAKLFPHWSVSLPDELWRAGHGADEGWEARIADRSVAFTSIELTEAGRPVRATEMEARFRGVLRSAGRAIAEKPEAVIARAVIAPGVPGGAASQMLQGLAMADGYLLLTTITCDDTDWCIGVWRSIHHHVDGDEWGDPARRPGNRARGITAPTAASRTSAGRRVPR